jgi:cytochrome c553
LGHLPVMLAVLFAAITTLSFADANVGEKKAQLCLACHKPSSAVLYHLPTLDGQNREYLYNQLKAYKEKRRDDLAMQTNTANLSTKDMQDIAEYFASRKPVRGSFPRDAVKASRGKLKIQSLPCATCHKADFSGNKDIPRLAGADPRYISRQIAAFAAGRRDHPPVGADAMRQLSEEDAEDLAQYFAELE